MTAKDKASEIVEEFWTKVWKDQNSTVLAIQCAIIHVKGIIQMILNHG